LPETRIDQRTLAQARRQLSELFLYSDAAPGTGAVLAVSEPPPPGQPDDPVERLLRCINLQKSAISRLVTQPSPAARGGALLTGDSAAEAIVGIIKEAVRQEQVLIHELRALQAESATLRHERDRLVKALQRVSALSLTDELTGLPNRRAFVQRLDQELSRRQRTGQRLAMVLLDIDNFKAVNDSHGHYAGDMLLRCYAQRMAQEIRQHDLLARYGGEEFVLLLPETTVDDARVAMEKLGERIRSEPLHASGIRIELPTFSAGIAGLHEGESAVEFVNRADGCLYAAKRLGRNRIEIDVPSVS